MKADNENCGGCRYYDDIHCLRHAPQVITLISSHSMGGGYVIESKPWSGWPLTTATGWCGEWKELTDA